LRPSPSLRVSPWQPPRPRIAIGANRQGLNKGLAKPPSSSKNTDQTDRSGQDIPTALVPTSESNRCFPTREFPAGNWTFDDEPIGATSHIALRGRGPLATTLDFTGQQTGAQGILATEDGFVIQSMRVLNPKGDGVRVEGADGVVFQGLHVEWNTSPENLHGAYGIYPVQCTNVLVDNSQVRGSSDAGIYVGQSDGIIVRRSWAFENVAGIEIENSKNADVYLNYATNNTGGLLVFDNPGLQYYGCRAHTDPAKDQPTCRGTRIIVMATDTVEIFNNVIRDHQTVNIVVVSFKLTQVPFSDPNYNLYPERIDIHDNELADGGYDPVGDLGIIIHAAFYPANLPDIVVDDITRDIDPTPTGGN
jgi:hypothetical protein